jgi:hypothetical protein
MKINGCLLISGTSGISATHMTYQDKPSSPHERRRPRGAPAAAAAGIVASWAWS